MSTSSKKNPTKILNPYSKELVDIDSREGKKLKRLVKNCKKCLDDEIYDDQLQKCVKRTPKNLAKLRDFDKFCKKYKIETIKLKSTDSLAFGKILNAKIPGGNLKIKDVIGPTKAKIAVYELEKKNKNKIKILAAFFPITLTLLTLSLSNPRIYEFIKNKIYEFTGNNPFLRKIFSKVIDKEFVIKSPLNDSLSTENYLQVKVDKNDLTTIEQIKKDSLGSYDIQTSLAKINVKVLGIKGVNPFTNLKDYVLKYEPFGTSYTLSRSSNFPQLFISSDSQQNQQITNLENIKVDYKEKEAKKNLLKRYIQSLESTINKINEEKKIMETYLNNKKDIDILMAQTVDLKEIRTELDKKQHEMLSSKKIKMDASVITNLNKINRGINVNESKINILINKNEDILNKNPQIINKYSNSSAFNDAQSIRQGYADLKLLKEEIKEENINAIDPIIRKKIDTILAKINKLYNLG